MFGYGLRAVGGQLKVLAICAAVIAFVSWQAIANRQAFNAGANEADLKHVTQVARNNSALAEVQSQIRIDTQADNDRISKAHRATQADLSTAQAENDRLRERLKAIEAAPGECRPDSPIVWPEAG